MQDLHERLEREWIGCRPAGDGDNHSDKTIDGCAYVRWIGATVFGWKGSGDFGSRWKFVPQDVGVVVGREFGITGPRCRVARRTRQEG